MTITADNKKRVVLPGAKPVDVFAVARPLPPPVKTGRMPPAPARRALRNTWMEFDLTWDELRSFIREP
jgi:hypothetical protein